MAVVYFLVFPLAGLLMPLFGHEPLGARRIGGSRWVALLSGGASGMERQFQVGV